jgi:hypothetical protein
MEVRRSQAELWRRHRVISVADAQSSHDEGLKLIKRPPFVKSLIGYLSTANVIHSALNTLLPYSKPKEG